LYRPKSKPRRKSKFTKKLLLLIIIVLVLFNLDNIGRILYPLPYKDTIFNYADRYGLDRSLLAAVIRTESNFRPGAVSPKGAIGLMQIMPDTGQWAAQKSGIGNFSRDRLFEPEYNISIGAWYLADLQREFNGNITLMLAAYNGGRGNVKKWLDAESQNNPSQGLEKVPFPETRQFVRKVLWYRKVYGYLYIDKIARTESKLLPDQQLVHQ